MPAAGTESPSIVFGEGHRPEAAIRIRFEAFDGPLALLLSLIEGQQLDVLTVPLGALADAYLDALATLDGDRLRHGSAFVAACSRRGGVGPASGSGRNRSARSGPAEVGMARSRR